MSRREERIAFSRLSWLREVVCWIFGHHEVCVPASPTDDYAGTYCLNCGAHWNHADDLPPGG